MDLWLEDREKISGRYNWFCRRASVTYTLQYWLGDGYSACQFLSNTVMAIGSEMPPTAVLELFTIPVLTDNTGPTPMTKILSLGLPSVDDGWRVAQLNFYHPPIENILLRNNCLFSHTTGTDTQPFISTSSNDIVFATLGIGGSYGYDNISFVVHSSALLQLISIPSHEHIENTIPWESWGPTVTRWHEYTVRGLKPFASGQRCILQPRTWPWMGSHSWELWDFNPYRVRRLGENFTLESEKASLSVETEPSYARSHGIKKGVYSSLPFVKIIPKQCSDYHSMGVYNDRISGTKVRTFYNSWIVFLLDEWCNSRLAASV